MGLRYSELKMEDFPENDLVLKWKNGLWYRDDNRGYTDRLTEAGLYERHGALLYCFYEREGDTIGKRNGSCGVFAVPLRLAIFQSGYTKFDIQNKIDKLNIILEHAPDSEKSGVVIF